MSQTHYLLVTLGGKPQVIITTLDQLLAQGYPISRLLLFHTAQPGTRLEHSLTKVRQAISNSSFYSPPVHLELVPFLSENGALADIITPTEIEVGFRTIYQVMLKCKQDGARLHVCPAGGRKTMSLFSLAAAQLLFEEGDTFWHVVAEGEFLTSGRLHPQPEDDVSLVPVPLLRWRHLAPALLHQEISTDPFQALASNQQQIQDLHQKRLGEFLTRWLSPAEQSVAELVIREGLDNQAIGRRLNRSTSTVANQLNSIYGKLGEFLELEPGARANRHTLIATFSAYLQIRPQLAVRNRV